MAFKANKILVSRSMHKREYNKKTVYVNRDLIKREDQMLDWQIRVVGVFLGYMDMFFLM